MRFSNRNYTLIVQQACHCLGVSWFFLVSGAEVSRNGQGNPASEIYCMLLYVDAGISHSTSVARPQTSQGARGTFSCSLLRSIVL